MKRFVFAAFCLIVSLSFWCDHAMAQNAPKTTAPQTQPAKEEAVIRFEDGGLTVHVKGIALEKLLGEISRVSGLALVCYGSLEDHVSVTFERLPLEEALRRILSRKDYVLEYVSRSSKHNQPGTLRPSRLWLFDKGGNPYQTQTVLNGNSQAASPLQSMPPGIPTLSSPLEHSSGEAGFS